MPVRVSAVIEFSDEAVAVLRQSGQQSASDAPTGSPVATLLAPSGLGSVEVPARWELVEERPRERYTWPSPQGAQDEVYEPFRVYEGQTSDGRIRMAIGECERTNTWGREPGLPHHVRARGRGRVQASALRVSRDR